MKTLRIVALLFLGVGIAVGQTTNPPIMNREGVLSIVPRYQHWSMSGISFSQISTIISLYHPVSREASLILRTSGGSTTGDVTSLSGLADLQIGGNYNWEKKHIVFSLGLNIPTGKKNLGLNEFATSLLISNPVFALQLPSLGSGFNVNPGIVWAYSLSENVVGGLGASFQYKGKFNPTSVQGEYDPGDEVLLTGGIDLRTQKTASISLDAIFTLYGKDKLNGAEAFASGSKFIVNAQYRQSFGYDELWLFARYRTKAKNETAVGNVLVPEKEKLQPDNVDLMTTYTIAMSDIISLRLLGSVSIYNKTPAALSGFTLFGLGISPVIAIGPNLKLPIILKAQFGSTDSGKLNGIETGIGLTLTY